MPETARDGWIGNAELTAPELRSVSVDHGGAASPADLDPWFVGQSPAIERMRARVSTLARDGSAVMSIHGEPGSGKLRVAQWIHRAGGRALRPALVLDGRAAASVTDLDRVITAAGSDGGFMGPGAVLVQDSEDASADLLERLQQLLGCQGIELQCAIVLLSKLGPEQLREVSPAHARLLGRAGHAVLAVPALRHRIGDVAELARHFVAEAARRYDKAIRGISPQALSRLDSHDFPGNLRELQAIIEQAVLRSSGDWLTAESLLGLDAPTSVRATDGAELLIRMPGSSLREIEIAALRMALELSEGRIVRASELLGITRHALRRKLEKFNLNDLRAG